MAGLYDVIGLLYRADWTRLSLPAEVRFEQDGDLASRREGAVRAEAMRRFGFRPGPYGWPFAEQEPEDERSGYHRWRAALLIAPGRRYRLEYEGEHGSQADGSDGEQGWTLRPPDPAPLPPRDFEGGPGITPATEVTNVEARAAGATSVAVSNPRPNSTPTGYIFHGV